MPANTHTVQRPNMEYTDTDFPEFYTDFLRFRGKQMGKCGFTMCVSVCVRE